MKVGVVIPVVPPGPVSRCAHTCSEATKGLVALILGIGFAAAGLVVLVLVSIRLWDAISSVKRRRR